MFPVFFCYRGTHVIDLEVVEGGPLRFAYDILTTAFQYGNRAFTKYPSDIPDYFKQTFPKGYTWERTMNFEDGGMCTVNSDVRLARCLTDASCREKCSTVFEF